MASPYNDAGHIGHAVPMTPPHTQQKSSVPNTNPREALRDRLKELFTNIKDRGSMKSLEMPFKLEIGSGTKFIRKLDPFNLVVLLLTLDKHGGHMTLSGATELFINPTLLDAFSEEEGRCFRQEIMVRSHT